MSQYDSDEEVLYESGSETSFDDAIVGSGSQTLCGEICGSLADEEPYPYTVLSTEQVTNLMVDTIKEVNLVVQVRLLLLEKKAKVHF